MSSWTADELQALERIDEIRVAGRRNDGSVRTLTIVWHVVVDGKVYVRSVRGTEGSWYRGVVRHYEGAISWDGRTRDVTYVPDDTVDDQLEGSPQPRVSAQLSLKICSRTPNASTRR